MEYDIAMTYEIANLRWSPWSFYFESFLSVLIWRRTHRLICVNRTHLHACLETRKAFGPCPSFLNWNNILLVPEIDDLLMLLRQNGRKAVRVNWKLKQFTKKLENMNSNAMTFRMCSFIQYTKTQIQKNLYLKCILL